MIAPWNGIKDGISGGNCAQRLPDDRVNRISDKFFFASFPLCSCVLSSYFRSLMFDELLYILC